jgi:hypothetical protein
MKLTLLVLWLASLMTAQSATRTVTLKWTAGVNSVPITYNVFRCVAASATGCTPAVAINTAPVTGTTYNDLSAVVGQSYMYGVEALAAPCGPGSAGPCGSSTMTVLSQILYIPPRPAGPSPVGTVTLTITGTGIVAIIQ